MGTYGEDLQGAITRQMQAERAANGMTYADIAREASMTEQTVMRYLTGKRDMPMAAFLDICKALGFEPRELVLLAEMRMNRK